MEEKHIVFHDRGEYKQAKRFFETKSECYPEEIRDDANVIVFGDDCDISSVEDELESIDVYNYHVE